MSRPLAPVDPRPAGWNGEELCPRCRWWIAVRVTDGTMADHAGPDGMHCDGSGRRDDTPHIVVVGPTRYPLVGRLNAEVIADVYRRVGRRVEILREEP